MDGPKHMLVVEGEKRTRGLVANSLMLLAPDVEVAATGDRALSMIEERDRPVDLVVTDVELRGATGPMVARSVLEKYPSARVLFIGGPGGEGLAGRDLDPARVGFLQKPFGPSDLLDRARRLLGLA